MKFDSRFSKIAALCVTILLAACGQKTSSPNTCAAAQDVGIAYQEITASDTNENLKLIVKMTDSRRDFENFRADLTAANGKEQAEANKLSVTRVAQATYAVEIQSRSPAMKVIDRAIQDKKLQFIETDHATFSVNPLEATSTAENLEALAATASISNSVSLASDALPLVTGKRKTVIVGVIDTGVDYTHKDLAPYMWTNLNEIPANGIDDDNNGFVDDVRGWNFANNNNDPMADDAGAYHGTHVAGIVRTASQLAQQGIDVKIMPIKYLDSSGSGLSSNAVRAIDYAIKNGAVVLNNSWGSMNSSRAVSDAIERTRQAHMLFVAAAGNGDAAGIGIDTDLQPFYPAAYPHDNIISVAAGDQDGNLTRFSNYGKSSVDITAPGLNIKSTRNGNTYGVLSGTSMASPYVAGVAAMLWGMRPDLSYHEVKQVLLNSVTMNPNLAGKILTGGDINPMQAARVAVSFAHDPNEKLSTESSGRQAPCSVP